MMVDSEANILKFPGIGDPAYTGPHPDEQSVLWDAVLEVINDPDRVSIPHLIAFHEPYLLLEGLPSRQRTVIELAFGLTNDGPRSLAQIADVIGISTRTVSRDKRAGMRQVFPHRYRESVI